MFYRVPHSHRRAASNSHGLKLAVFYRAPGLSCSSVEGSIQSHRQQMHVSWVAACPMVSKTTPPCTPFTCTLSGATPKGRAASYVNKITDVYIYIYSNSTSLHFNYRVPRPKCRDCLPLEAVVCAFGTALQTLSLAILAQQRVTATPLWCASHSDQKTPTNGPREPQNNPKTYKYDPWGRDQKESSNILQI